MTLRGDEAVHEGIVPSGHRALALEAAGSGAIGAHEGGRDPPERGEVCGGVAVAPASDPRLVPVSMTQCRRFSMAPWARTALAMCCPGAAELVRQ